MNISKNWLIILVGAVVLFVFTIGCTPGKALTRRDASRVKVQDDAGEYADDESASFEEGEEYTPPKDKKRKKTSEFISDDDEYSDEKDISSRNEKYYQTGIASWYGREFNGKKTASGEKFDMNALSAAHRTLPFGSVVEVRNLANGKSVKVKINDRGPFRAKRIIDLSYAAGKKIGIVKSGEGKVGLIVLKKGKNDGGTEKEARRRDRRIEPVMEEEVDDAADQEVMMDASDGYSLQIGAFYTRKNAEGLKRRAERLTNSKVSVSQDSDLYKVRIEGIPTKKELKRFRKILEEEDINSYEVR